MNRLVRRRHHPADAHAAPAGHANLSIQAPFWRESREATEAEFRRMLEARTRRGGRLLSWGEVLAIARSLGHARIPEHRAGNYQIAIALEGPKAAAIATLLMQYGGEPVSSEPNCYAFGCPEGRDQALDAVRSVYGWTSVEPRG